MANYSLSINSTFQPFTYQELVAPVIHQQQVMDNLIEQYEKLSSQADVLEAMGANDRDKKSGSYSRYKAYSDSLRNEVDYLYQNGLDTTSRERLTDLRRRYNTEIVPIQNAWAKREQEVKDQMTASMANPSLMFTRNAKDTSLDQYLADPVGGYGVINGANITAQMSAMTKNLANKYRSGELERVDPATYNYIKKFGLDENMIRDWESYPTLKKMYEQVMQANGVTPEALKNSPNASSIIDKAHSYAEMGMWNAMGKDETQIVENFDYRLAQQTAAEIAKASAKGGGDGLFPGESYITDSTRDLPMGTNDPSNNKERSEALEALGYSYNKDKGVFQNKGKVTVRYMPSAEDRRKYNESYRAEVNKLDEKIKKGTATEVERRRAATMHAVLGSGGVAGGILTRYNTEVSLYDKNQKLLSRDKFIAQGDSKSMKEALAKYYDEKVSSALKVLGLDGSTTSGNVGSAYMKLRDSSAASFATVRDLHIDKNSWNDTTKGYRAQRIDRYKGGTPIYDSKSVTLGDILNKKNSDGTPINVASHWGKINGQEGLILSTTENGKDQRYFIPVEAMGNDSNVAKAQYYENKAEEARKKGFSEDSYSLDIENFLGALHTAFTLNNQPADRRPVKDLTAKQSGLVEE